MKKIKVMFLMVMVLEIMTGCAGNQGLIKTMIASTRQDVFQEPSAATSIPPGFADLRIVSSLKTHQPGIYSYKDIHGTPEYKLLANIDGQAVLLTGSLREESGTQYPLHDSEEGQGMRYLFQKDLRLKAGMHKIFISLPFDEVTVERQITLAEGTSHTLVLEPIYRRSGDKRRIGFYTNTSFKEGIKGFRTKMDNLDL